MIFLGGFDWTLWVDETHVHPYPQQHNNLHHLLQMIVENRVAAHLDVATLPQTVTLTT